MAKEYLEKLSAIMKQATAHANEDVDLECKHFFSGAAVYAGGRICISYTPAGFAIKLPGTSRTELLEEKGATRLRYFPEGPIKKDYVVLPKTILEDAGVLQSWIRLAIEHALTLPEPQRKRGNKKAKG